MKTATITWVTYNNYGTILQAYALQKMITGLGHANEILWDKEILKAFSFQHKITKSRAQKKDEPLIAKSSFIGRAAHMLASPRKVGRVFLARTNREKYENPFYASQGAFDCFRDEELKLFRGVDPEKLEALNERYDAFVAGSDQIWSVFESDFNPYYYLDFATKRKIAYAPCMGTDRIPDEIKPRLCTLLSDFHALSAREYVSMKQLADLTGRNVEWVADPTLLLTKEQWSEAVKLVTPPVKGRYLLCYFLENRPWYFEQAKYLSRKLHLRPVLIPNKWDYLSNEYVINGTVGPKEFVALFQNAEYVLTDSYHGSVFSLIFEKGFQYLLRFDDKDPFSQNIRVYSLFHYLELDSVIVTQWKHFFLPGETDKEGIRRKLAELRDRSVRYLNNSLA